MKIMIKGNRKITKKNNKKYTNIQARFFTSGEFCNKTGIRIGDIVKLKIGCEIFYARVSDYITVPYRTIFTKEEIKEIKNGKIIGKNIDVEILDVIKNNPNFKVSESLVAILAHVYSDGSITSTNIHYTNTDRELIEHFKLLVQDCFPTVTIDEWEDGNILHLQIEAIEPLTVLSRFVNKFGRKSITNPHIPDLIMKSDEFGKVWLKHTFADEGWVNNSYTICLARQIRFKNRELVKGLKWTKKYTLKDNYPIITSNLNKEQLELIPRNNLIDDEAKILQKLGVNCRVSPRKRVCLVNGDIGVTYELCVRTKDFISIGFCCSTKQKKLEKVVKISKMGVQLSLWGLTL